MKTQHKLELTESFGIEYCSNVSLIMKETRSIIPDYICFSEETLKKLIHHTDGIGIYTVDLTHKSFCQTPYRIDNSLEFGVIEAVKENV